MSHHARLTDITKIAAVRNQRGDDEATSRVILKGCYLKM